MRGAKSVLKYLLKLMVMFGIDSLGGGESIITPQQQYSALLRICGQIEGSTNTDAGAHRLELS